MDRLYNIGGFFIEDELIYARVVFVQLFIVQIAMWFKMFDWLRLFNRTAIYPVLLQEVLVDVLPFGLMMLIIFGLFGNGIFIFNALSMHEGDKSMDGLREDLGYGMVHGMLNEILMMVGEFHYHDYNKGESFYIQAIHWTWFCLGLIITNIVFLNTLIAIISDTVERVTEKRNQIIVSCQADLLCDWLCLKDMIKVDVNEQFLFIVKPIYQDAGSHEHWDGKLSQIKKTINQKHNELR